MVGREKEIQLLKNACVSGKAELIAVYGRRRIGKTYLVHNTFNDSFAFSHTGLSPIELSKQSPREILASQLTAFRNSLIYYGYDCPAIANWLDAFLQLELFLKPRLEERKPIIIFFDELPWMDTPSSKFLSAFEWFWNGWACRYEQIKLIVCGSSVSYMSNRLIQSKAGFYGRVTLEIPMLPFTLKETEAFFLSKDIRFSRYDIVRAYMAFGGIPYYLDYFKKGDTIAKSIDALLFGVNPVLRKEFDSLFPAIFDNPHEVESIVRELAKKNIGLTRKEICDCTKISDGGTLSTMLNALEHSSMIYRYASFGSNKKEVRYKLLDPFCIFYLRFVEGARSLDPAFWQGKSLSQSVISWRGVAFENICFNHIAEIKEALGIRGISTNVFPYIVNGDSESAQIDIIIERADNFVNLCEAKFYGDDFIQTKKENDALRKKTNAIVPLIPKKASIHPILITTFGLTYNEYSGDYEQVVTLDDLFA